VIRRLIPAAVLLTACSGSAEQLPSATTTDQVVPGPATTAPETPATTVELDGTGAVAATQPVDGDRSFAGRGGIGTTEAIDIAVPGDPEWLLAAADDAGITVLVVLGDGAALGYRVTAAATTPLPVRGDIPVAAPVALLDADEIRLLAPAPDSPAPPTVAHGLTWWTDATGLVHRSTEPVPDVAGLPDGRIAIAPNGTAAVLTDPTDRYPHGVLGDRIEAGSVTIIDPTGTIRSVVPIDDVVEGTSPMWADLDGDGSTEVVVTASTADEGARLVAITADGSVLAEAHPVGRGFRWRHQIGSFVDGAGPVLVAVKTPHIGGIAEFYRLDGDSLRLVATERGITSHVLGSRNLDLALIADAAGDGIPELVAPTSDRMALRGISLIDGEAVTVWEQQLPGRLASNLAAATAGDALWIAAGLEGGIIRLWPPQ
jgi:hypothetical protein